MNDTNKKTINAYEVSIDQYIKNTPSRRGAVVEHWINASLEELPLDAAIFEIGSAFGRDAKYIEDKGFIIEKTDATQGFVDILMKSDQSAHLFNLVTDELVGEYDLILANAVLLHLNSEETKHAVRKIFNALKTDGKFALTLKEGEGEAWQTNKEMAPRFFNYWRENEIVALLKSAGFTAVDSWTDETDTPTATWIMLIAHK